TQRLHTLASSASLHPLHHVAAAPSPPQGALQFFSDEATFVAALGIPADLATETFDGGAPVGPFPTLCAEPMSSASNDVCFIPGQLAPGFAITSTSGGGIIEFPPSFLGAGQSSRAVGATTFADSTIVSFSPTIAAASAIVYGGLSAGNTVDVEVFDESGTSLGSTTVLPGATRDTAVFVGVVSAAPMGKIVFNAENDGGELIDNLQFRPAGLLPPGLAKSFAPSAVAVGNPSTLTITLGNQAQPGPATLSADLTDSLPSGLLVAAAPNASTTCASGTVTALAGAATVTLGSGAQIPGAATCTVTVDVSATAIGLYPNTMAAGALQTDLGNNRDAANATLTVLSGGSSSFPPAESFDEIGAPQLPDGWISSVTTGSSDWTTTTTASDSAPNSAHAPEIAEVNDFTLDTPAFTPVAGQNVSFRHQYNLEHRFDGAVLEISIDGGEFADIIDAGGSFVTGGYSFTIQEGSGNPLTDRYAWTGNSNGFVTTIVTLPAAAIGQSTRLRFRTADDASQTADGANGWWIDSIALGVNPQPPIAAVEPASLSFTVDPDATATNTLTIANADGSDPLTFTVESRGAASKRPKLIPYARLTKKTQHPVGKLLTPREPAVLAAHGAGSRRAMSSPWAPEGSLLFQWDDGSVEDALGVGANGAEQAAVWLNRFHASDALVIHSISIGWPPIDLSGGDLVGLQANLVVYYDADGDGDPTNAIRVGADDLVTIAATGDFQTYPTNFSIPAAGDVYIGFVDQWALTGSFTPRLFPTSLDESASQGMSYLSSVSNPPVDIVNLGNNDINGTIADIEQGALDGNWLIRATATGGGSGGPCSGPIVDWLTATPSSGSVNGGSSTQLTVTVNPSAGGLVPGNHAAELCITTNDPAQSLISVPVSVTVTGTPPHTACDGGADELFCDGFDHAQSTGSIVSGAISQAIAQSTDGSSFDFATGDYHGYDVSITTDDINLYVGGADGSMYVYWYGDLVPPAFTNLVGGVVDAGGVDFAVLHSGDTVGPGSTVSGSSQAMTNWLGGTDGYVGVAFYNESTSTLDYGYLHLTTASPFGFPAQALGWAYDSSGAAITIP
ncbi:MAG: hypothetical protein ABI843_04390, partial [Dokdonella sp.]